MGSAIIKERNWTIMATIYKRGGRGQRGGRYYFSYFDHNGKRHSRSARTTDKATAERIAAKYEADAALRREGVVDPQLDAICDQSRRSVESHLKDYEAKMVAASRSNKHVTRTIECIRTTCQWAGFTTVSDIAADGVNRRAGQLKEDGFSARTIASYLTAMKGFTKWLSVHHKLPRDPLASVSKPNQKADRRRERRILLYTVAIQTGLRSSELRSLTRGCLFLEDNQPFITCKAGTTKNRKDARQYIQLALAKELLAYINTKTHMAPVFKMPEETVVAAMLRADLADARREWIKEARNDPEEHIRRQQSDFLAEVNHEGETLDFHSLRHTCGAWLSMNGAHPKAVQSVMRHSTIVLTMDTYGHLFPGQDAATVARFPSMLCDEPKVLQATGTTDDLAIATDEGAQHKAQQLGREKERPCAIECEKDPTKSGSDSFPNPLRIAKLDEGMQQGAKKSESTPGRTRTCNQRIRNPLLYPLSYGRKGN
jgi:integrase